MVVCMSIELIAGIGATVALATLMLVSVHGIRADTREWRAEMRGERRARRCTTAALK